MSRGRLRSEYTARVDRGFIVIEDQWSPARPALTVTNNIEQVIEDLARANFDMALPVIYRDSDGRWDRIAVERDRFLNFVLLGCSSYAEARTAMIAAREGQSMDAPEAPLGR